MSRNMPNSHIHDHLTDAQIKERNEAIVADYAAGLRVRDIKKKYRIGGSFVSVLISSSGLTTWTKAPRKWVNKRVRNPLAEMIVCSRCDLEKESALFPKDGLVCIACSDKRLAAWRSRNRATMNANMRRWVRSKRKSDARFRLVLAIKSRLVRILNTKGRKKNGTKIEAFLGCDRKEFITYIESMMLPGMTWENRRYGVWHLDHIIPCSAFDHSSQRQVYDCWHYTNLRPMWGNENMRKHKKILVDCMIGPKISANVTGE